MADLTFYSWTVILIFSIGFGPFFILWMSFYLVRKVLEWKCEIEVKRNWKVVLCDLLFGLEGFSCLIANLSLSLLVVFATAYKLVHWTLTIIALLYILPFSLHIVRERRMKAEMK